MKKYKGTFPSASRLCRVHFYVYSPEKPRAVVMLSHGMCEYAERYRDFAQFLCGNDIALVGADHVGHGSSVSHESLRGYFGHKNGYINLVRDLRRMKRITERLFPDVPHILLGHSMGSFLARILLAKYGGDWAAAIFLGTAGELMTGAAARGMIQRIIDRNGDLFRTEPYTELAFGLFNLRTENHRTRYDWLSRDDENVDRFCADPKCNFIFTAAGYRDLLDALICCNSRCVIDSTPTDIPLLFMSGGMDPVGEYGHGVRSACLRYLRHGCEANLRIYREARHELLFELNRKKVMEDILKYIEKRI